MGEGIAPREDRSSRMKFARGLGTVAGVVEERESAGYFDSMDIPPSEEAVAIQHHSQFESSALDLRRPMWTVGLRTGASAMEDTKVIH